MLYVYIQVFNYLIFINKKKPKFLFRIKDEQQLDLDSRTSTNNKPRYYSNKLFIY